VATRIFFFGSLREKAGCRERLAAISLNVDTVAKLVDWIASDDDALRTALVAASVRIAIDHEVVLDRDKSFGGAEEIAFMPPFSGG
jgi:molybdopterin converting factor small subunit